MILRLPPLLLAAVLAAMGASAQTSDPTKKNPPAEIVPPKPEMRPPAGQKTVEPASPSALSPGSPGVGAPPPPALPAIITELPVAELDKILTLLRQRYVSPAALAEPELKRATVQGLLQRLGGGATLIATPAGPPEPSPFRSEIIDTRAGYVRLGSITKEALTILDSALEEFTAKPLGACILDLRATPAGTDFELAAEVCRRFCPKGQLLFSVLRTAAEEQIYTSKIDPRFRGLLLVLIDADAAGNAEIIAGTLRPLAKAIVIGQRTKGEAAEYAEEPLAGGHTLRYAVAEPKLPGSGSILAGGLEPDLPVQVLPETLAAVLRQELEKGVAPLLIEPERPRMNEAALVAGTNPELDALQANQRLRGERTKPLLRDDILLRALDVIASLSALKKP